MKKLLCILAAFLFLALCSSFPLKAEEAASAPEVMGRAAKALREILADRFQGNAEKLKAVEGVAQMLEQAAGPSDSAREEALKKTLASGFKAEIKISQVKNGNGLGTAYTFAMKGPDQLNMKKVTVSIGFVCVEGLPQNLVDGVLWEGTLYPAGTFSYSDLMGAGRTVKRYATTPELALKLSN